ncbi:hypothetical protein TRVA0_001S03246 [Trichomonascus vanleenenianus]|uniref:uncharacterized protein n=1 Tax=Trichomonascus vanleenenianus TaxID=2268995 RepID=UPI003ECABD20
MIITHDHRGRPLSPAMADLLSATVIPRRKKNRTRKEESSISAGSPKSATLFASLTKPIDTPKGYGANGTVLSSTPSTCSLASSVSSGASITDPTTPPQDSAIMVAEMSAMHRKTHSSDTVTPEFGAQSVASSNDGDGEDDCEGGYESDAEDEGSAKETKRDNFTWSWMEDMFNSMGISQGETTLKSETAPEWLEYDWSDNNSVGSKTTHSRTTRRKLEMPEMKQAVVDHPLSSFSGYEEDNEDNDEERIEKDCDCFEEQLESSSKEPTKKSFVSTFAKSLKKVASSFSMSQEKIYSSQVFTFSPRSTDEPIPSRMMFSHGAVQSPRPSTPTTPSTAPRKSKKPVNLKTYAVQTTLIPHLRPREVRMNPDFYRVYAVETLMRLNGKLNPDFQGRATMILEPRSDISVASLDSIEAEEMFGIRKRLDDDRKDPPGTRWGVINASDFY